MSDDFKGMWDTLPGHTFIRGLWRVSAIPLPGHPETMIESYELLTEDPDALTAAEARITALEAENAKLRAALEKAKGKATWEIERGGLLALIALKDIGDYPLTVGKFCAILKTVK